jgi:hypothetical protein
LNQLNLTLLVQEHRLESQLKWHIATASYLLAVWISFGSSKTWNQDIAECMT